MRLGEVTSQVVRAGVLVVFLGAFSFAGSAETPRGADQWAGQIFYTWESPMPDDSPLKKQIQQVHTWSEKSWTLGVVFSPAKSAGSARRYGCTQGNLAYRHQLRTRAKNQEGDKWMKTSSNDLTSTKNTDLSAGQCGLTLVVDSRKGTYVVDGGFEAEDLPRKGVLTIEIKDENGTRTVSQPIDDEDDVDEGFRFSGEFSGATPSRLEGSLDLSEPAFGGLEYWVEDVGGIVSWRLYRGGCENARRRCLEDLERDRDRCIEQAGSEEDFSCDLSELTTCAEKGEYPPTPEEDLEVVPIVPGSERVPSLRDCAETACSGPGNPKDPGYQEALDRIAECVETYLIRGSDCITLCR